MKRRAIALGTSLGCVWLSLVNPARAEVSAADKASAEALFNDGIAAVNAGRFADGCKKFEASQALDPTLGTELRLADCYERSGRSASAWALFKESQGIAHRKGERDREDLARERSEVLAARLSYLTIEIAEPLPAGLNVQRNGNPVPLASLGVAIPVDPGPQTVTVSAPSRRAWSRSAFLSDGDAINLHVPRLAVVAEQPLAVAMNKDAPSAGSAQRTAGVVTSVVGLAAALGGAGLGWYAKHENDLSKTDRYCPTDDHNGCTSEGLDLRERAQALATASTITLVAGGALLATGIVLWSTAPRRGEDRPQARLHLRTQGSLGSFQTVLGGVW